MFRRKCICYIPLQAIDISLAKPLCCIMPAFCLADVLIFRVKEGFSLQYDVVYSFHGHIIVSCYSSHALFLHPVIYPEIRFGLKIIWVSPSMLELPPPKVVREGKVTHLISCFSTWLLLPLSHSYVWDCWCAVLAKNNIEVFWLCETSQWVNHI